MGQDDGLGPEVVGALRELAAAAAAAAERLGDEDSWSDLEELGALVAGVLSRAQAQLAAVPEGPFRDRLWAACRRLREARDLLDDGEPPDAAAFQVQAARDQLAGLT